MAVTYTSNLKLGLPTTGTESGTWGDVVNDQITTLVDQSVSGTVSLTSMTNANYTLTNGNGNAANEARYMSLLVPSSLTLTAARNITVPSTSKMYIVKNATTGGFSVTVKTSAGTGIEVPNGATMLLYCDGTNVIVAFDTITTTTQNSGQLAGLRNRIINGGMQIAQRGTSSSLGGYSCLDRYYFNNTGTPLAASQTTATVNGISSYVMQLYGAVGNTSQNILQRIEADNCYDLAGQNVTISFWTYQTTGSTFSLQTNLSYATVKNDFTSITSIGTNTTSIPNATWTYVSFTLNALPANAALGLSLTFFANSPALTTGFFQFAFVQLELGSVATTFEQRSYGLEFALCQRYYQPAPILRYRGYVGGGSQTVVAPVTFPPMRVAPTVTATFVQTNTTGAALNIVSTSGASFIATVTATGSFDFELLSGGSLSAEL